MQEESEKYGYGLETRGELLWVSVHVRKDYEHRGSNVSDLVSALSMSVHVLKEEMPSGKMRWVRKDKGSLAGRVLFLGSPNSFAVDASQLGGDAVSGGCAFFVHDSYPWLEPCCVFWYSLIDDKAKFVEQLPKGRHNEKCTWLFPQPTISQINERLEATKWWNKNEQQQEAAPIPRSIINIERPQQQHYKPCFKVIVGNLPRMVDSSQLRRFFSKHGKVFDTKVICKKKTKIIKMPKCTLTDTKVLLDSD